VKKERVHTADAATRRFARRSPSSLSLDLYIEEELEIIDAYNQILPGTDRSWLPVNCFTQAVRDALDRQFEHRDLESFIELFSAARDGSESVIIPERRRTLVRLLWDNF
jgi:hypothetical protein